MKSKNVVVSLAIALTAIASSGIAQAQLGGAPAQGDASTSSGATGQYGKDDYMTTGVGANKLYNAQVQNYVSPNSPTGGQNSFNQTPQVSPMVNAGSGGLNQAATAPMAPNSVNMAPFPSGSFKYGFDRGAIKTYRGPYEQTGAYGGQLPNTSTGSVDFNTVDMSGIAPVGMSSPAQGMSSPISIPTVQIPNQNSSVNSTLNWLQNSFFGN